MPVREVSVLLPVSRSGRNQVVPAGRGHVGPAHALWNLNIVHEDAQNAFYLAHPKQYFHASKIPVVPGEHHVRPRPLRSIDQRNEIVVTRGVLVDRGKLRVVLTRATHQNGWWQIFDPPEAPRLPPARIDGEHSPLFAVRTRIRATGERYVPVQITNSIRLVRRIPAPVKQRI